MAVTDVVLLLTQSTTTGDTIISSGDGFCILGTSLCKQATKAGADGCSCRLRASLVWLDRELKASLPCPFNKPLCSVKRATN
jgi:hypothetical protein